LLGDDSQPANDFPADDHGYGYDNIADVLSMSPLLFEKYNRAVERMLDTALDIPVTELQSIQWEAENLEGTAGQASGNMWILWSNGEIPTTFKAIDAGIYVVSALAAGQQFGDELTRMGFRMDSKETVVEVAALQAAPALYQVAFYVEAGEHEIAVSFKNDFGDPGTKDDRNLLVDWIEVEGPYPTATSLQTFEAESLGAGSPDGAGHTVLTTGEAIQVPLTLSVDGTHELSIRLYGIPAGGVMPEMDMQLDGESLASMAVTATSLYPEIASLEQVLTAGMHTLSLHLTNPGTSGEETRSLVVDWVRIFGATDLPEATIPEARARIFLCNPSDQSDDTCITDILKTFARRAWRRPVTDSELTRLEGLFTFAREETDVERGVRTALHAILLSPHFLFRVEIDPQLGAPQPHAITDHELATRLSYALWSSMPDESLDALADTGDLHIPDTLEAQVRRMLLDPKSDALTQNFAGQWLYLRAVEDIIRDSVLFPEFNVEVGEAMRRETELLFESTLRGTDNGLDMLTHPSTQVNPLLAEYYGLEGHSGEGFEALPTEGTHRVGLLSHGSILSVTSNAFGTSPVKRGKWIMSQILCIPPSPPPPDVETTLFNDDEVDMSMRDRLAKHREDPKCAPCHAMMDPIGLGLDNYSPIGKWRTEDDFGFPIDASGTLPDGTDFESPEQLIEIVRNHPATGACFVRQLFTYMLGRGHEVSDMCTLESIAEAWAEKGYVFEELLVLIAQSDPFILRQAPAVPDVSGEEIP